MLRNIRERNLTEPDSQDRCFAWKAQPPSVRVLMASLIVTLPLQLRV
jgi:hypothetical protein